MKKIVFLMVVVCINFFSCDKKNDKYETKQVLSENNYINNIVSSFNEWWVYHNKNVNFSKKFIAADTNLIGIDKKLFYQKLLTGNYICILEIKDGFTFYKLHELKKPYDKYISTVIKQIAKKELFYLEKTGMPFPDFNFNDIKGINYTNSKTLGNYLIIKCWFINCKSCINEFDELNKFTVDHQNVNFISLALDEKDDLIKFIKNKPFKYKIIANQEKFIQDELGINEFPTHILINKEGNIEKYFDKAVDLISYFEDLNKSEDSINENQFAPPSPH
jgi:peroxiredoxin